MGRRSYAGGAVTTFLTAPVIQTDVLFLIDSSQGWPTGLNGPMAAVIDRGEPAEEKVLLSEVNAGSAVVSVRGYDGTSAQPHSAFATFELCITAIDADEANAHVNSVSGVHGLAANDRVVGEARAATLTNKSMSGVDNTFTDIPRLASPQIDAALTSLQSELDQEEIDRAAADVTLQNNINTNTTAIATNATAIATETTNRIADVDAEETARINADAAHVAAGDPHAQYTTAAELNAAIAAATVDSGWITATAGFVLAANWTTLVVRYRHVTQGGVKRVELFAQATRNAPAINNPVSGNVGNVAVLSAIPAAIAPTGTSSWSGPGNSNGRLVGGTISAGTGAMTLCAIGGTSDFAAAEIISMRANYFV